MDAKEQLNYAALIKQLDEASGFTLYQLRATLDRMLEDPRRIIAIKKQLQLGQRVNYFDDSNNTISKAVVEQIKQARAVVKDVANQQRWNIPLCAISIEDDDTEHQKNHRRSLSKDDVSVGTVVGFVDRSGIERSGNVVRLNQKTVTIDDDQGSWRVPYSLLHEVTD